MARIMAVGETVAFTLNTGVTATGIVVQRTAERKQPAVLLIERPNGWRCFRLEEEVSAVAPAAVAEEFSFATAD